MNNTALATTAFVVVFATSLMALVVATVSLKRSAPGHARRTYARRNAAALPVDLEGLRREVHALRVEVSDALRHLAVVRYDAFGDMGGHLSWSLALLDDAGNGVILTSIHGRSEARTREERGLLVL